MSVQAQKKHLFRYNLNKKSTCVYKKKLNSITNEYAKQITEMPMNTKQNENKNANYM